MLKKSFFVIGTDTSVGKTVTSCLLLRTFSEKGYRTVGMKPIATGAASINGTLVSEDAQKLAAASSYKADLSLINPYAFAPPVSPHIAAHQAQTVIDFTKIHSAYQQLSQQADIVIIEGVGGLYVPLTADTDLIDLIAYFNLPVILVVGMRLGCLNHALLTAHAIQHRGLNFAGWVANRLEPDMLEYQNNLATLCHRLPAPLLAKLDFLPENNRAELTSPLDLSALLRTGFV